MTTVVVKVGGEILRGNELPAVAADVAQLTSRGTRVVVVHGGGPQATALQERLGQTPHIVAGRRITDADALSVMKMVVAGELNCDLCAGLIKAGAKPVGLSGVSSLAIEAVKRPPRAVAGGGPDPIDFGWVGDVVGFNLALLEHLLAGGYVPVLACLGADASGAMYNINADVVANRLAVALDADHLVLVTGGVSGVLRDKDDPSSRIGVLRESDARAAIADGTVSGGMIPKIDESLQGMADGIGSVHIVGRLRAGDLLSEIATPGSVGTALVADKETR